MFPFADDTKSYSVPIWTFVLIGLNVLFFFISYTSGMDNYIRTLFAYGVIPARFVGEGDLVFSDEMQEVVSGIGLNQSTWAPPLMTLLTSMFLHGGIMHLIGNMWFMWLFADNVEDRFGKLIFPIFYIICGLAAGLLHIATNWGSTTPTIGASGAIAGVMGAYIYLFPNGRIASLVAFGFYWRVVHIPSFLYLIIWLGLQFLGGLSGPDASNVAFWAHIGGFLMGVLLAFILSKLNLITKYPGDRGYSGHGRIGPSTYIPPPTYQQQGPRRRYVWRD